MNSDKRSSVLAKLTTLSANIAEPPTIFFPEVDSHSVSSIPSNKSYLLFEEDGPAFDRPQNEDDQGGHADSLVQENDMISGNTPFPMTCASACEFSPTSKLFTYLFNFKSIAKKVRLGSFPLNETVKVAFSMEEVTNQCLQCKPKFRKEKHRPTLYGNHVSENHINR